MKTISLQICKCVSKNNYKTKKMEKLIREQKALFKKKKC